MRAIDADALIADCQLAQKQADRHGREFANAFYSGGGEVSTEWWCVEDMIENALTIEPQRKKGKWITDKYGNVLCSECNWCAPQTMTGCLANRHLDYEKSAFCWHCGADMREPEDIPMEYFESGGK